ncbi:MAG: hypothetical protein Kow0099_22710 [Candidatus Abyssubacteria bacterium]
MTRREENLDINPRSAPVRKKRGLIIVLVALGVVIAAAGAWWSLSRGANVDIERITGRWIRPDGGYVIEIRDVDESGKMDAAYYNPRSIHIAKAQASREGSTIKLYIELRDVNYPGSHYVLSYDPKTDQLNGTYYQAVAKETYEIFFERMK